MTSNPYALEQLLDDHDIPFEYSMSGGLSFYIGGNHVIVNDWHREEDRYSAFISVLDISDVEAILFG